MARSAPSCSICEHRHTTIPAIVWCQECEEALCGNCQQHHSLSRISKCHDTIPITKYIEIPSSINEIKQFCDTHGEKFILYCKVHDSPCCRKCTIENHSSCNNVVCLEDVIHNAKTSNVFTEIEHSLAEQCLNVKRIKDDRERNIQELSSEKERIKSEVQNMKKSIIEHLERLEEYIITDLNDAETEHTILISQLLEMLSEKERFIFNIRETLYKIKEHASNLQTFLSTKQIEDEVNANDNFLSSLIESNDLKWKRLSFNLNPDISTFMTRVKNLGHIMVDESPSEVKLERKKEKQAQIMLPITPSLSADDITLKLKNQLSTEVSNIRGLTVHSDGNVLLTDYDNYNVVCINNDGTIEWKLRMPHRAFDVELLERNVVAVSCGGGCKQISLLDLHSRSITKTYILPSCADGTTAIDGNLLCSCRDRKIQALDLSSASKVTIHTPTGPISPCSYLTTFGDKIYYTDRDKNIVVCCDMKGKLIWKFHDETVLKHLCGIDVDENGFIYVIGATTCNLVVISPDGQQYRQLLTKENGLRTPQAIFYYKKNYELLIANKINTVFIYRFVN